MKLLHLLFLFLYVAFAAQAQETDKKLKKELDSIYALDQKYRDLMALKGKQADSLSAIFKVSKDSLNQYLWENRHILILATL